MPEEPIVQPDHDAAAAEAAPRVLDGADVAAGEAPVLEPALAAATGSADGDASAPGSPPTDDAAPAATGAGIPAEASTASHSQAEAAAPGFEPAAGQAAASAPGGFSELFEASATPPPRVVQVGQRVRGKIVDIGDPETRVAYGGRSEGLLATSELRSGDGSVLLRVGDPISLTVAAAEEPVRFTIGKKRALLNAAKLRLAHENKQPVSGVVRAVNKGGFDVRVSGVRAFCPLSQIDTAFVQDAKTYLGQTYAFRILRWENGGRNIVLSRRAILKLEAESKAVETRQRLAIGAEFDGIVTRVQPFGAFVDIGGLEGLLHVSRMGRGHVPDPGQMVSPGQTIRVRVSRIESAGAGKERIALARADLGPDPWEQIGETLREGEVVGGRVVRLTDFGAFVTLQPGIDGLVHISELSAHRATPETLKEILKPGDEVQVRVLRIDREKKRVSLSIRQAQPGEPAAPARPAREPRAGRPPRDRDRDRDRDRARDDNASPGSTLTHNMAEQLGALRRKLQVRP